MKKNNGFIRTGALVPFIVVVGAIAIFNIFFLESIVKSNLEKFGTKINNAQVDISKVNISFASLRFEILGIQVSDSKNAELNSYEIAEIKFALSWDALLRAKFLIEEASVNKILIGTKRTIPARLVKTVVAKKQQEVVPSEKKETTEKKEETDLFGDISKVVQGLNTEDMLNDIEGKFKSKAYFEDLEATLSTKEEELKKLVSNLPKESDFKNIEKRIAEIDWKGLKDIKKAPKILKEADQIKDDANDNVKKIKEAIKKANSEIAFIENAIKKGETLIKEDLSNIDSVVKLPNLEAKSIARSLFGPEVGNRIDQFENYFNIAKEYMPPKKEKVIEVKPPRGKGVNYRFGTPNSYPLFWLKLAKIDSKSAQGDISGSVMNISTDQTVTNKPTQINLNGNFIEKNILGFSFLSTLDHRHTIKDSVKIGIEKMEFSNFALSKSSDVKFNIQKAQLKSDVDFNYVDGLINMTTKNKIENINYDIKAQAKLLNEILNNIASDTPSVDVTGQVKGTFADLNYDFKSSLANSIKSSLERQMKEKVSQAKNKVKNELEKKLGMNKSEVEKKLSEFKGKYLKDLNGQEEKFKKISDELLNKKNSSKVDPLKSLKKKLKFKR